MRLATFFEKFELIADAPDAVARLREIIYECAAQGRLVPDALERPPEIDMRSLGDLVEFVMGQAPAGSECNTEGNGTVFVKVGEFGPLYPRQEVWTTNPLKFAKRGDVLVCVVGATVGKLNLAIDCAIGRSVAAIHPSASLDTKFLYYSLMPYTLKLRRSSRGSAQGVIGKAELNAVRLWAPSRNVQKRIVAKVEELMAWCDRLEAQQAERAERRAKLARAALARFTEAPTPANLAWLFHEHFTIPPADLRKAILTLAVQGKLVPQNSNDEPARRLVDSLARRKQAMIAAKQVRQGKVSRPHASADAPDTLPAGWEWVNVDSICFKVTDGTHFTPCYTKAGIRFVSAKDVVGGKLVFDHCKFISREEHEQLYRRCNPEYHDIVISKSGSIGSVALIDDRGEFSLFESLALLKFDQSLLFPKFLVYALRNACALLTADHIRGVAVKHLHLDILRGLEVPLPPLAEQHRIVAKADELMALVDELEAREAAARRTATSLLDALADELTSSSEPAPTENGPLAAVGAASYGASAEVIDLHSSPEFIRATLAAEITERLCTHDTFGQVKLQKLLYLVEYHFQLPQIDSHPRRFAAGPHDPELIEQVENKMAEWEWFQEEKRTGGKGHRYRALARAGAHRAAFEKLWPTKAAAIRAFLDELKTWKTERCERFATLYAAWNDLLLWREPVTEERILREVLERWDPAKLRIPKANWLETLQWMKREGFSPKGFGRSTAVQPQPQLF